MINSEEVTIKSLYTKPFNKPDWKVIPTVEYCLDSSIDLKVTSDENINNVIKWARIERGDVTFTKEDNRSSVVRKVAKMANGWKYPTLEEPLLSSKNLFDIESSNIADEGIRQMTQYLNYQMNHELDKVALINDLVSTAGNEGTVVLKPTWKTRNITVRKAVDNTLEYDENIHTVIEAEIDPITGTHTGMLIVDEVVQIDNKPVIEVLSTLDVAVSDNGRKALHTFESTLSDLYQDERYSGIGDITDTDIYSLTTSANSANIQKSDVDIPNTLVTVTEYWFDLDINNTGISEPIVCAWVGETIIRMERNPYPLQIVPFITIKDTPSPKSPYGTSDIELLGDNQDIESAVFRGLIDSVARTAIGQTITSRSAFDADNRAKFENGEDCIINDNMSVDNAVKIVTYPEVPQSVEYIFSTLKEENEALTGIKSFSQGGITGSALGNTATAVRTASDAVASRKLSKLRRLAKGLVEVAKVIIRLNMELVPDKQILNVLKEDEVKFSRDQVTSNLNFIDIAVTTAELNALKADRLGTLLQTIGNNMKENQRNKILSTIAYLENLEELGYSLVNDPIEPSEFEKELQNEELKLAKAETAVKEAQAEYYVAMAEQARGRAGESDLKMMNGISGTDHARKLEELKEKEKAKQQQNVQNPDRIDDNNQTKDITQEMFNKS